MSTNDATQTIKPVEQCTIEQKLYQTHQVHRSIFHIAL